MTVRKNNKDWRERATQALDSPCTRCWVKDIINQALLKDPVDAYHDIELVYSIVKGRMLEILGYDRN